LTNFIPFIALPWEFFHIKIKLGMESELNQEKGGGRKGEKRNGGWSTELTFCLGGGWGGNGRQYSKRGEEFSSFDAETDVGIERSLALHGQGTGQSPNFDAATYRCLSFRKRDKTWL
jgi:hypothetical protein